jgi:hypothetical protein
MSSAALQQCDHETIEKGECLLCGLMINGGVTLKMTEDFAPYHKEPFVPLLNLEKDLGSIIGIDDEIRRQALQIGLACSSNLNILGARNAQLFALVYMAYLYKQREFNPLSLSKSLQLTKKQINAIQKQVTGIAPKQYFPSNVPKPSIVIISPLTCIPELCKKLGVELHEKTISEWAEVALDSDATLFEEKPEHIAGAIIKYVLNRFGIKIRNFEALSGVQNASIRKHIINIGKVLDDIKTERPKNQSCK